VNAPGLAEFRKLLEGDVATLVEAVLAAADSRGLAVYAVGGPVRDLLLGLRIRDIDLLVEGEGAAELAESAAPADARLTRHDRFGTILLQLGSARVDLSATRRETYEHPGALPRVEPGSLEDDLMRRDFSVNALALPLSRCAREKYGRIIDLDDGLDDLRKRRLRVLHARSFHDDPTRVLRAARLAPRLGLSLTHGSRAVLRDALRDGTFGRVSGDRLRREMVKVFGDAQYGLDPSRALRLLSNWHVLGALEPGLDLGREVVVPLRRLGRAVESPPWRSSRWRSWISGMGIWLQPLTPALRRRTLRRFSIRGDVAERIGRFPNTRDVCLKALLRARGRGAIDAVLAPLTEEELHALYAVADAKARRRIERFAGEDRIRRAPISGTDLVDLGLEGPALGRALVRIRTAYLDGALKNREEAIALAREIARRRSPAKRKPKAIRR
jgi:tRNA nucleotidyltransferase (CCA-adding enzyme)